MKEVGERNREKEIGRERGRRQRGGEGERKMP
jgi:hypothetical protein